MLPVIATDVSYKNLAVNNGDDASVLFMNMMAEPDKRLDGGEKEPAGILRLGYFMGNGTHLPVSELVGHEILHRIQSTILSFFGRW